MSSRPARGFTVVELVVVISLMGVLSALAMPRLLDRGGLAERGAADELRAVLRSARQLAIVQGREVCLVVGAARASAVYVSGGACDTARPVPAPAGAGALAVDAPAGLAFGGDAQVRFSARGHLVPMVDRRVTLGTRQVRIERSTGAAR